MPLYSSSRLADEAEDVIATVFEHDVPRGVLSDTYTDRPDITRVATFARAYPTSTIKEDVKGVILYLADGSEIHLTITARTPKDESL